MPGAAAGPQCGPLGTALAHANAVRVLMVGTLQVPGAMADRQLADDVLEQGIDNALALLGAARQGWPLRVGTAYRIRTGDLRLERAVSWASRRMRH